MDPEWILALASHEWVPVDGDPRSVLSRIGDHLAMVPAVLECARCGSILGTGDAILFGSPRTCSEIVVSQVMES
jgi:hypothetical protein